jgi:hypothetical protein
LTELRAADLPFTPDAAAAFFRQVMGLQLDRSGNQDGFLARGIFPERKSGLLASSGQGIYQRTHCVGWTHVWVCPLSSFPQRPCLQVVHPVNLCPL